MPRLIRRWLAVARAPSNYVYRGWLRWRLPTPRERQDRGIDTLVYLDMIRSW